MRKTQQQLAEQVAFLLKTKNPLYYVHASIEAVMNELETILPGKYDVSDLIVQESIRLLAQRGRLAKSPEVLHTLQNVRRERTDIEWNDATANLLMSWCREQKDFSEATMHYVLDEHADSFPKSTLYREQVAANDKAQRDVQDSEDIRSWALELFQTNKKAAFLKNSGGNHLAWNVELAKQVKRFAAMNIDELRALKAQYATKAELTQQAEASIAKRKQARFESPTTAIGTTKNEHAAYPKFPEYFYQGLTKIPYNREVLNQIASQDKEFYRHLCLKYGPQVGERQRGDQ